MPTKIRLMRIGARKRPFYRVVAVDGRAKRTGKYLENLGTYNPITQPKTINLNQPRIDHWLKLGAVPSYGFLRIIKQAPQKPPRKPKKAQPDAPVQSAQIQPVQEAAPQPATPAEEATPTPVQEEPVPVETEVKTEQPS